MAVIIRITNNQHWNGQCQNADRDCRLFQCHEAIIDIGYKVGKDGAMCRSVLGAKVCAQLFGTQQPVILGERATGNVTVYRDIDRA